VVSIADVAEYAGVSQTTVSHALSGNRKVSDEVQARVRAAMKALDYVPSRSAQNLALGTTRILALVVPDIGNEYFAELAKGVERTAVDRGYNLILATTGFDRDRELRYLEMINSRAVDGIVYAAGAPPTDEELSALVGGMPLVFVDEEIEGTAFTAIVSDNEMGGRLAAEHLASLGHRSALIINVAGQPVSSVERSRGFLTVWEGVGGVCVQDSTGNYTESSGREIAERYLDQLSNGEITAVFAYNDLMAIGVVNALRARGISVPKDVSVVGFDDVSAASYTFPALTTVRQDVNALGTIATTTMIDSLESKQQMGGERTILPVELVVRESTGSAPR
jgi:DNA-binding LacI/PurR family transcriptional regulator